MDTFHRSLSQGGLSQSGEPGGHPDRATLCRRTSHIHASALSLLESAHGSLETSLQALHANEDEGAQNEVVRDYRHKTARHGWAPRHVPADAIELCPSLWAAHDQISAAKADIHAAFSLLPTLRLSHATLLKAACGEAVSCAPSAGGGGEAQGAAMKDCTAFLRRLLQEVERGMEWVAANRGVYDQLGV